jgi:hypothetical protein
MKHLAKDVYVHRLDKYNIVLKRKGYVKSGDNEGDETWTTIGYYSSWKKVIAALDELGMTEWMNGDVAACRKFITEACNAVSV